MTSRLHAVLSEKGMTSLDSDERIVARLGHAAIAALYDELELAPKPGLVSFVDSGSHSDMDAATFMKSLFALRHYYVQIAELGWQHAEFKFLESCGLAAEGRMTVATKGINTHRGAIFTLGLVCAAAGASVRSGDGLSPSAIRASLQRHWGANLEHRSRRSTGLQGSRVAQMFRLKSAGQEAAHGFPTLFNTAYPALAQAIKGGLSFEQGRLSCLMHVMAELDDTNLVYRGGMAGLTFAQESARSFLANGGVGHPQWRAAAWKMHCEFVERRLSPGGAADLVAAACWLHRVNALAHRSDASPIT